jgi:hypothetical protein
VQWRAGCLPQEQVASFAQTQPPGRPQQVTGTVEEVGVDIVGWRVVWFGLKVGGLESRRLKVGEWKIGEELKGLGVRWCSEVW